MELRHLRYFIAAAQEEHFGRASERLHVTRPAVSQIIADLEQEIGTALFERMAHRVRLTPAGHALLPQLQATVGKLGEAVAVTKQVGQGRKGALTIGYGSLTLLHPLFRQAIHAFHESYPEVVMSLLEMPTAEQPRALAEGRIHAGFMHFGPRAAAGGKRKAPSAAAQAEAALDRLKLQSGALGLVVPREHPLAARESVSLADLAHESFVVVPRSSVSPGYGPLSALCEQAGVDLRIVQEVATISTLINLVSVGVGIGFTVTGTGFVYPPTVAVLRIDDLAYPTSFSLGWTKGRIEPVLQRFIDVVKKELGSDSN